MTVNSANLDLARLIDNLSQAGTLDLYRVEMAARKLRNEARRIVEIRRHLHLGMAVRFLCDKDGTMHGGKVVAMRDTDLTIDDANQRTRWTGVPYAALDLQGTADIDNVEIFDRPAPPRSAPTLTRAEFKVGGTVSFLDRDQRLHSGRIVRLNQKTATLTCESGEWRVPYRHLHHLIDL